MKRLPVNIISGFLGSGKTTAIIKLFKQKPIKENWAILINEYGKQSIDAITLNKNTTANEIVEIHGGCICCTSATFFEESLKEISKNESFDRLIIEPTGLGGLKTIKNCVKRVPVFNLHPVICLIENDIQNNPRITANGIFLDQIQYADILAVSKCDTFPEKCEATMNWLKRKFTDRLQYLFISKGEININLLKISSIIKRDSKIPFHLSKKNRIQKEIFKTSNLIFESNTVFDYNLLLNKFEKLTFIHRIKGYLKTNIGWIFVNNSANLSNIEKCSADNYANAITFIYTDLNIREKTLRTSLKSCIIS